MVWLVLLLARSVVARTWVDVVDTTVYASALVDPNRELMQEWAKVGSHLAVDGGSPSLSPIRTGVPVANIVEVPNTNSPSTHAPTSLPTHAPSASPSASLITCPDENSFAHVIRMHDDWGDGWNGATLRITTRLSSIYAEIPGHRLIFEGTLKDGYDSHDYVCLVPQTCYSIDVGQEERWLEEVKWEIRSVADTIDYDKEEEIRTLAKGRAPTSCQFSIPDRTTGELVCPFQCLTSSPAPTWFPTSVPTGYPSPGPKSDAIRQPATGPTVASSSDCATSRPSVSPPSDLSPTGAPFASIQAIGFATSSDSDLSDSQTSPNTTVIREPEDVGLVQKEPYRPEDVGIVQKEPYRPPVVASDLTEDPPNVGNKAGVTNAELLSDYPSMVPSAGQVTLHPGGHAVVDDDYFGLTPTPAVDPTSLAPTVGVEAETADLLKLGQPSINSGPVPSPKPSPTRKPSPKPHYPYGSFFFKFQQMAEEAEDAELPSDYPSLSPTTPRFT